MPKIYFYKLTTDNGGAPCVQNDLLSLAICKPMMRKTATEEGGDLIFGFAANSLHRNNPLIYVARVTKKLCTGEYFKDVQVSSTGRLHLQIRGRPLYLEAWFVASRRPWRPQADTCLADERL
jgi:Nucleotide modification associated domain 2